MDELIQMRTELKQLEKKEQDLREQLSRVREEIEAHKSRIEDCVRRKRDPIGSLPFEILSNVLEMAAFHSKPGELARVSRVWRDVILRCPTLWNNIVINRSTNESLVRAHVTRSAQYPLDITIHYWAEFVRLYVLLDILIPHAHRWRTLCINENGFRPLPSIQEKLNNLKFPSLISSVIAGGGYVHYPTFLRPENSPSLKSLVLRHLVPWVDFPSGQRFTDLDLTFTLDYQQLGPRTLSSFLSSRNLTTLKLVYYNHPPLQPDSISLPFLTSLTLKAKHPRGLISAIVVPQLSYLDFAVIDHSGLLSTTFRGFESKFGRVRHFVLHTTSFTYECAQVASLVFPNVHHVTMNTLEYFFFRANSDGLCFADHWESLKSLIFCDLGACDEFSIDLLVQWLGRRQFTGRPMLHVKFSNCVFAPENDDIDEDDDDDRGFSHPGFLFDSYSSLRQICNLQIVGVLVRPIVTVSLSSSSLPHWACTAVFAELDISLILNPEFLSFNGIFPRWCPFAASKKRRLEVLVSRLLFLR